MCSTYNSILTIVCLLAAVSTALLFVESCRGLKMWLKITVLAWCLGLMGIYFIIRYGHSGWKTRHWSHWREMMRPVSSLCREVTLMARKRDLPNHGTELRPRSRYNTSNTKWDNCTLLSVIAFPTENSMPFSTSAMLMPRAITSWL